MKNRRYEILQTITTNTPSRKFLVTQHLVIPYFCKHMEWVSEFKINITKSTTISELLITSQINRAWIVTSIWWSFERKTDSNKLVPYLQHSAQSSYRSSSAVSCLFSLCTDSSSIKANDRSSLSDSMSSSDTDARPACQSTGVRSMTTFTPDSLLFNNL